VSVVPQRQVCGAGRGSDTGARSENGKVSMHMGIRSLLSTYSHSHILDAPHTATPLLTGQPDHTSLPGPSSFFPVWDETVSHIAALPGCTQSPYPLSAGARMLFILLRFCPQLSSLRKGPLREPDRCGACVKAFGQLFGR
jgi:hypothetical protein